MNLRTHTGRGKNFRTKGSAAVKVNQEANALDFLAKVNSCGLSVDPIEVGTLQANITKLCNQTCTHCHVDAGPGRREQMSLECVDRCLEILGENDCIENLDLTGGAPELNPHFDYFVMEAKSLGKHVMVRHNLTVTLDGNPQTGEKKTYIPEFFAENHVEVISSLPYYSTYFTDRQRGKGVFEKSIESLGMLNKQGYGDGNLELNLVYNPSGAFLPPDQKSIERDFREKLERDHGIRFDNLYTLTNMPINRFERDLKKHNCYEQYMEKLADAFNPLAVEGIMCRSMISVSHEGNIYDCDFNQMLGIRAEEGGRPLTIFNFDVPRTLRRQIKFGVHCFGCTAGAGSSCGGVTTES